MPFYYHVSYNFIPPQGGTGWGSAAVTWEQPLTTFRAVEELRHQIEDNYKFGRDKVVIIAITPLPDEGGDR